MPKYHQTTVNTSASRKNVDFFFGGGSIYIYIYIVVIHIYIYIDVINMISTDPYIDWIHKSMIYNNILLYS